MDRRLEIGPHGLVASRPLVQAIDAERVEPELTARDLVVRVAAAVVVRVDVEADDVRRGHVVLLRRRVAAAAFVVVVRDALAEAEVHGARRVLRLVRVVLVDHRLRRDRRAVAAVAVGLRVVRLVGEPPADDRRVVDVREPRRVLPDDGVHAEVLQRREVVRDDGIDVAVVAEEDVHAEVVELLRVRRELQPRGDRKEARGRRQAAREAGVRARPRGGLQRRRARGRRDVRLSGFAGVGRGGVAPVLRRLARARETREEGGGEQRAAHASSIRPTARAVHCVRASAAVAGPRVVFSQLVGVVSFLLDSTSS